MALSLIYVPMARQNGPSIGKYETIALNFETDDNVLLMRTSYLLERDETNVVTLTKTFIFLLMKEEPVKTLMEVVGQRVVQFQSPVTGTLSPLETLRLRPAYTPALTWPVCWELVQETRESPASNLSAFGNRA